MNIDTTNDEKNYQKYHDDAYDDDDVDIYVSYIQIFILT